MSEIKSKPVKIIIEDVTGENGGLIWELNRIGVEVGDIRTGLYNPENKSVQFSIGCNDCSVWVGETCRLLES